MQSFDDCLNCDDLDRNEWGQFSKNIGVVHWRSVFNRRKWMSGMLTDLECVKFKKIVLYFRAEASIDYHQLRKWTKLAFN